MRLVKISAPKGKGTKSKRVGIRCRRHSVDSRRNFGCGFIKSAAEI